MRANGDVAGRWRQRVESKKMRSILRAGTGLRLVRLVDLRSEIKALAVASVNLLSVTAPRIARVRHQKRPGMHNLHFHSCKQILALIIHKGV